MIWIHAIKVKIVNYLMRPVYAHLGYQRNRENTYLSSHYYQGNSNWTDIVSIHKGYLSTSGWLESKNRNASFKQGQLIPWLSYPSIRFLESLELSSLSILEFGSGASTAWFSKHCKNVISYEFDADYAHSTRHECKSDNLEILTMDSFIDRNSDSIQKNILDIIEKDLLILDEPAIEIARQVNFSAFVDDVKSKLLNADLVLIDGGMRNLAAFLTANYSKEGSLVIVDNTDILPIRSGLEPFQMNSFVEIPFSGLAPLNPYEQQTSLFFRSSEHLVRHSKGEL